MIKDIKNVSPFLFVWLAASSLIYLFIFWSRFNINPVEYISIAEVVNYAGHFFFLAMAVPLAIGIFELIFPSEDWQSRKYGDDPSVIRWSLFLIFSTGGLSIYIKDRYPALSAGFYTPLILTASWISTTDIAKRYIPTYVVRLTVLIFLCLSPYYAITESLKKSESVINEKDVRRLHLYGVDQLLLKELIYVGRLGNYLFYKECGSKKIFEVKADSITFQEYVIE